MRDHPRPSGAGSRPCKLEQKVCENLANWPNSRRKPMGGTDQVDQRSMSISAQAHHSPTEDPVSNVLKWVLLVVAIRRHLRAARLGDGPDLPSAAAAAGPLRHCDGRVLMTGEDIVAGKAGFQKADLMDYGSLYGMGSYFGEDYTASALVRLGAADRGQHRRAPLRQGVRRALSAEQQAAVATAMQRAACSGST